MAYAKLCVTVDHKYRLLYIINILWKCCMNIDQKYYVKFVLMFYELQMWGYIWQD
jgi:hypothetical protein